MMNAIVSVRMTIKNVDGIKLAEMNCYGTKIDERTIIVEGRYFKSGRKDGFGKAATIYENTNGQFHKVVIDKINEV